MATCGSGRQSFLELEAAIHELDAEKKNKSFGCL